jgi:putative transposase
MLMLLLVLSMIRLFGLMNRSRIRRRFDALPPLDPLIAKQRASWHRTRAKPPWVGDELVRMKAFGKNLGYKKLADAFNRRFVDALSMSVAPSTVRRILIKRRADVIALRREVRNRVPRTVHRNSTWGLDLTTVTDMTKRQRLVLGLVDHGTRACISLTELADKRSLTLLREIVAAIRQFGVPKTIRVDNDPSLKSRLMHATLRLIGVKLQVVQIACPWMNGRIERFFGTFKAAITRIQIEGADLSCRLIEFRCFYNHVRAHQHIGGRTPAEAWSGVAKQHGTHGEFASLWHGELSGWHFPKRE